MALFLQYHYSLNASVTREVIKISSFRFFPVNEPLKKMILFRLVKV